MKKLILIIDDDEKLNDLLKGYLSKYDFEVIAETRPGAGLRAIERYGPSMVILDVMLPEMDGFEVCREIRKKHAVPVIMLTARGDVTDRVVGLELGADDYLPKPFDPRELAARIQSILRRAGAPSSGREEFGHFAIDHGAYRAFINGEAVELTTMEFSALSYLVKKKDTVVDRDALFERLKGFDDDSFDRSIDVLISRLRQKLGDDPKRPRYIKTVWGRGYAFIGHRTAAQDGRL